MVGICKGAFDLSPSFEAVEAALFADEVAAATPPTPKGRRVAAPSHCFEETETRHDSQGQSYEIEVPKMIVNCARCGNAVTVHGTTNESYKAACCLLRETCPKGEANFYAEP